MDTPIDCCRTAGFSQRIPSSADGVRRALVLLAAALIAALILPGASAFAEETAQDWPTRPVRIVVNFPPGGAADQIARVVGQPLQEALGQPVVVENRAGAGGNLGGDVVAHSTPDGHTLLMSSGGMVSVNPYIYPRMSFDPAKDLVPVAAAARVLVFLVTRPEFPARDAGEFLAYLRSRPGKTSFGSPGSGSSPHLAAEMMKSQAGVFATHVPYRGAAPAVTELLAGRIQVLLADVPALIGQVRSGALPALAITAPQRLAILPDVPTAEEAGVPGLISETWYGVLGPAGMPADRVMILHGAVRAALEDEATRRVLLDQGGRIVGSNPEEFATFIRGAYDQWGEVVRATGMRLE